MDVWKDYRNYEVSVWTLQDNYITTLKSGDPILVASTSAAIWPQTRMQGQIQNGQIELNIDGTQTFTFDIPMYLYTNGERIENPNWYDIHTENVNRILNENNKESITGNILTSMRKVKVIFDKWENINNKEAMSASTFEFIIVKVQETHEQDNLICHVECEGLAFHELGKIGYKRCLSADQFNNEYYDWSIKTVEPEEPEVNITYDYSSEAEKNADKPINNLQYWMENHDNGARIKPVPKNNDGTINYDAINPTEWYYDIRMAHTSLVHDVTVDSNKIYEEGFPTDWDSNGSPIHYMEVREMTRLVDLKESNLYNITQDLAEKFEVFCRYEYIYDNNYTICGRLIIFYNNFLQEGKDVETLMYPNSASKISREMDSTDVSTKMFVRSVDNDALYTGTVNIIDCKANKTREDYLLNFNYLYDIGTINKEQYEAISTFEINVRKLNDAITPLQDAQGNLANLKTDVDAKVTNLTKSIELDEERITENMALINALDSADGDQDGFITRDYRNPETFALLKDSSEAQYDTYYIQLNQHDKCQGIQPETLKLYKTYNSTSTKTYKYSIGFRPWKKDTVEDWTTSNIRLPSKNCLGTWLDCKQPVYKGTIGSGSDADVKKLPTKPETGWIYRALTENHPSGYTINVGGLFIYTEDGWQTLNAPTGNIYDQVPDNSKIKKDDLKELYEYDANHDPKYFKTSDTSVSQSKTYYTKYAYTVKKGFYVFTLESLNQINGAITQRGTCKRYNATDTSVAFISSIRHLYYMASGAADIPTKPTMATADTSETEIVNYNVTEKWSSYLSSPDEINAENISLLDAYNFSHVWETYYSSSAKYYSDVVTETGDIIKDSEKKLLRQQILDAPSKVLKDELHGSYKMDDYNNLDKVTGLFKSPKQGSYFSYTSNANGVNVSAANSFAEAESKVVAYSTSANQTTFPTDKKQKYVIVKEQQYCSNGNVIYLYYFKYYNKDELYVSPDSPTTKVKSITPIFYLQTNSTTPAKSNPSSVKSAKVNNAWTSVLPDKTKNEQIYYRGWAVTPYSGQTKYYVLNNGDLVIDTTLKKRKKNSNDADEDTVPKYVYGTFKYKPEWYYEQIKNCWEQKLYEDNQNLQEQEARSSKLDAIITNLKDQITNYTNQKDTLITKFEHMMGAALRESYWQPEDEYQDYGAKYEEKLKLYFSNVYNEKSTASFLNNITDEQFASIGWDSILFDEEDKLYYESTIRKTKVYYPCIDLLKLTKNSNWQTATQTFLAAYSEWAKSESRTDPYSFFFNPTNETIPADENSQDIRYCQYYTIGSNAKLAFVRIDTQIKPILILLNASSLSEDQLQHLYSSGTLGQLIPQVQDNNVILTMDKAKSYPIVKFNDRRTATSFNAWLNVTYEEDPTSTEEPKEKRWIDNEDMENYEIVYPRILIPSLKLKNNSKDLVISINNKALDVYEHYYVLTKSYYNNTTNNNPITIESTDYKRYKYQDIEKISSEDLEKYAQLANYYTITIKPDYLFTNIDLSTCNTENYNIGLTAYYAISNADLDIYLDAKKILKENAYPKVSYEIEVSKWSPDLLKDLHSKLAQLVMINDTDLKLQNTFGYISSVTLDLDHEENDTIEVTNYKTKFEDLFSKIVAETEEMHKNSRNIGLAGVLASGDSVNVTMDSEGFSNTIHDPTNQEILQQFLSDYFDGPEVVQFMLQDMWNEAGAILASAAQSLNSAMSTTTKNSTLLAGFRENVTAALSPKIFTGSAQPTTFKPGDIWINEEDNTRMVATGYSGRGGFTQTYNGKLAEISGSHFGLNAETGDIDIINETNINLMSGKDIQIAAGDNVNIVGNKSVNIGGTTINMASCNIIGNGYPGEEGGGGIHLVATDYNYNYLNDSLREGATSRVDIMGEGIELASKNGIIIKSGAGIDVKSSDDENVSAVSIDKDKGIYIGATKGLSLYSGDAANYYYGPYMPTEIYEGDYWIQTNEVNAYDNVNDKDHVYRVVNSKYTNLDEHNKSLSQDVNYYYANAITPIAYQKAVKDANGDLVWQEISANDVDIQGASVELTRDCLLLGVANIGAAAATAISMSNEEIILAAGKNLGQIKLSDRVVTDFTAADLTGLQIKSDYIGMAAGSGNNRTLLSLIPKRVLLGTIENDSQLVTIDTWNETGKDQTKVYLIPRSEDEYYDKWYYNTTTNRWNEEVKVGPEQFEGSYLWLGSEEIYLGSMGHLTMNTNNIKIQTKLLQDSEANANVNDSNSDPRKVISQMGFVLGKELNNNTVANRKPYFGFWVDANSQAHFIIDADLVRLSHDGVVDSEALSGTLPTGTQILYILHNSKSSYSALNPSGYTWATLTSQDLLIYSYGTGKPQWKLGFTSPANLDEDNDYKYVWSTTQSIYETVDSEGNKINKYRYSIPRYEGLADNLTQKSYKEYKYFQNELQTLEAQGAALAETSGWSIKIPNRTQTSTYYYGDNACTVGDNITANISINDNDGNEYTIRKSIATSEVTITVTDTDGKTRTIKRTKDKWIIKIRGIWIATNGISQKANNDVLYSRIHVIKNDGTSFNTSLEKEEHLALLSQAAIDACNIANGSYPVPAVSSTGLVIDGNNAILGATGQLMLLGNASIFVGTSSSNSALKMDASGISLGTGTNLGIAAGGSISIMAGQANDNIGTITIDSDNFKVFSDAENGSPYFKVGGTDEYIQYVSAKTENNNTIPAHLEVKGAVTATSFILTEGAQTQFASAVNNIIDPSAFKIDGLSSTRRKMQIDGIKNYELPNYTQEIYDNAPIFDASAVYAANTIVKRSEANDNLYLLTVDHAAGDGWDTSTNLLAYKKTVELTSTHALVLGANSGVYVIKNDDSSMGDTYLAINKTKLDLDFTANNYIHMSKDGIDIKGKRISINDREVWARDDIIFSATFPDDHPTDRDWVWIKPNANLESNFIFDGTGLDDNTLKNTVNYHVDDYMSVSQYRTFTIDEGHHISLASDATITYTVALQIRCLSNAAGNTNYPIRVTLSAYNDDGTIGESMTETFRFAKAWPNTSCSTTKIMTGGPTSNNILATAGSTLKCYLWQDHSGYILEKVKITAGVSDAVANGTRVLCEVFYYSE